MTDTNQSREETVQKPSQFGRVVAASATSDARGANDGNKDRAHKDRAAEDDGRGVARICPQGSDVSSNSDDDAQRQRLGVNFTNPNPAVHRLPDTARGEPRPHTQDHPSRLITLPLEHVKILLSMAFTGGEPIKMAVREETQKRVACVEAWHSYFGDESDACEDELVAEIKARRS